MNLAEKHKVEGIFPAMVTPFTSGGSVDYQSLAEVIDFFIKSGVNGLYVLGTTGEWPLISKEQRKSVLEFVMNRVNGRIAVMAHIGALPVPDACELARHAETSGVSAISSIPPYYFPFEAEDVESYYELIFNSVSEQMPVFLYNVPSYARNVIPAKTVVHLKERYPNLAGIKDSQGNPELFKAYREAIGKNGIVLVGSDDMIRQAFQLGGSGVISGNANIIPELFISLRTACQKGTIETAQQLQGLVNELAEATHFGRVPLLKTGLGLRGVPAGLAMAPYCKAEKSDAKVRLKSVMQKILRELENLDSFLLQ